jgi:hypothetical protein
MAREVAGSRSVPWSWGLGLCVSCPREVGLQRFSGGQSYVCSIGLVMVEYSSLPSSEYKKVRNMKALVAISV